MNPKKSVLFTLLVEVISKTPEFLLPSCQYMFVLTEEKEIALTKI